MKPYESKEAMRVSEGVGGGGEESTHIGPAVEEEGQSDRVREEVPPRNALGEFLAVLTVKQQAGRSTRLGSGAQGRVEADLGGVSEVWSVVGGGGAVHTGVARDRVGALDQRRGVRVLELRARGVRRVQRVSRRLVARWLARVAAICIALLAIHHNNVAVLVVVILHVPQRHVALAALDVVELVLLDLRVDIGTFIRKQGPVREPQDA